MEHARVLWLVLGMGAAAGCAPAPDAGGHKDGAGEPPPDPAACVQPPATGLEALPEGEPGYDDALAALDLDALPATVPLQETAGLARDLVAWMLDADVVGFQAVDRDEAKRTLLGRAVLGAIAVAGDPEHGAVDLPFLRRGLLRFDACEKQMPATLDDFRRTIWDFPEEPDQTLPLSVPKQTPRHIWRDAPTGAFVAQTVVDGVVRETEAILTDRMNDPSQIQFVAYDADGSLVSASTFAAGSGADVHEVRGAVPFSCMACHRTVGGGFNSVSP